MMNYGAFGPGWSWMLVMGLFALLVLIGSILVVVGVIQAGRRFASPPPGSSGEPDALEIIRRRFAGGEITAEEYELMRRHLEDRLERKEPV